MKQERLTIEEIKNCYDYHSQGRKCGKTLLLRTCNELLEYKQLEKELGIDLITLVKIFSGYGIFGYTIDKDHKKRYIYYFPKRDIVLNTDDKTLDVYWQGEDKLYRKYKLSDYGKKKVGGWALTKEELEK